MVWLYRIILVLTAFVFWMKAKFICVQLLPVCFRCYDLKSNGKTLPLEYQYKLTQY